MLRAVCFVLQPLTRPLFPLPQTKCSPNKDMDCAGVCNGTAVTDDCGQCALGTTKKEFNADKDCAGQCFGQHIITDPYVFPILCTHSWRLAIVPKNSSSSSSYNPGRVRARLAS